MYEQLRQRLELSNIPALDGIRALAVALVIFYHAGLGTSGALGVLVFFVLSGFLITWLLLKEDEKCGTISLKGFYRRRCLRIFPAFYCFLIITVLLRIAVRHPVPWPTVWSSFFYYANYYYAIMRPAEKFMGHTWSLAVEEQFYLCWPLLFLVFRKNRKRLAWVTLGVIALVVLRRTVLCLSGAPYQYTRFAFDCRADSLLWGCLLAVVLRGGFLRTFVGAICRNAWLPLLTALVVALIAHTGVKDVVALTVLPPTVAILLCQLVVHSGGDGWGWLNSGVMKYLGQISYPLYLYHGIGLGIVSRWPVNRAVDLCVVVLFAVATASLSYYFVERPFLAYKRPRPVETPQLAFAGTMDSLGRSR